MVENINTVANLTSVIAPPVQSPSLAAALQSFITGSGIPNVPQALLQSPSGQQITAIVVATNPSGQVLLQTGQGQVVFNSPVQLAVGQHLSLETLPQQAPPQRVPGAPPPPAAALPFDVRLVRVNGVPVETLFPEATRSPTNTPETAARTQSPIQPATNGLFLRAAFPQTQQRVSQQNLATSASVFDAEAVEYDPSPLQSRASFRATVLSTPGNSTQNLPLDSAARTFAGISEIPETLTQLKAGDILTLKITGGTLVIQQSTASTLSPQAFAETETQLPLLSTAFSETEAPALTETVKQALATIATAPNAADIEAAVESVISEELPASSSAAPKTTTPVPAPGTLPGLVIAKEADGSAIVQTPLATLRLPPDVPLPRGTQLSLKISDVEPALDIFAASQLPRSFQTGNPATDALLKGSTSLDALFKQLAGLSADTALETAQELIPQPGRQFGNKILQFIASVQQESLPDAIRQAVPKEMVEQLSLSRSTPEFSGLKNAMVEAPPPQWSFMLVPVMQGEEMSHMRWFKRKQPPEDSSTESGDGTRFVVELETKSLGQIQLDGLFFNQPTNKEFDLVIRSQKEFSREEQEQIAEIYNNYGEITGYHGSLRFEQTATFAVQPLNDLISRENREISA